MRILLIPIFLMLFSNQARSQSEAVFRSTVVPGWGQFYNEQPLKGWIVLGVEAASIASWLYFDNLENSKYNEYLRSTDPTLSESLYEDVKRNRDLKQFGILAAGGVWFLNMADAWFFHDDKKHISHNTKRIGLKLDKNEMM